MIKSLIATALLSFSISAPTKKADNNSSYSVYGVYNLRDSFNFTNTGITETYTITFENKGEGTTESPLWRCKTPLAYTDIYYGQLYLSSIELDFDDYVCDITINYYNMWTNEDSVSFRIVDGDYLSDLDSKFGSMMFYVHDNIILHGDVATLFNDIFTLDVNDNIVSYSGYYSFASNISSVPRDLTVFGSVLFDNSMYYGFTDYGYYGATLGFYCYYAQTDTYSAYTYSLPFSSDVSTSANILMTSCKMSKASHNYLSSVGVFAYVRDTSYDNADWQDLLFSVMDSPIYMINRLLSFEIFGLNLFVALAGLLTICALLVLIKRFF